MDAEYLRGGHSYYTVESHISYIAQSHAGDAVYVTAQIMGHDAKRLHLFNRIHRSDDNSIIATGEHMYLHVDTTLGKTVAAPQYMIDRIERIADAQSALARPAQAGRFVGAPR
jgi:carnitine 3-dehydrogenase